MVRHGVQRRTRRPTVTFLGWDELRPFASIARVTRQGDFPNLALERHDIQKKENKIQRENADVAEDAASRRGESAEDPGERRRNEHRYFSSNGRGGGVEKKSWSTSWTSEVLRPEHLLRS